jgi:hypothetical protein
VDNTEAQKVLREQLEPFSGRSHFELTQFVEEKRVEAFWVHTKGGKAYQVEIQFFWDDQPGDTIRILGSVDDGGIQAFFPLTESVLIPRPNV